jgi:hypothetical protein
MPTCALLTWCPTGDRAAESPSSPSATEALHEHAGTVRPEWLVRAACLRMRARQSWQHLFCMQGSSRSHLLPALGTQAYLAHGAAKVLAWHVGPDGDCTGPHRVRARHRSPDMLVGRLCPSSDACPAFCSAGMRTGMSSGGRRLDRAMQAAGIPVPAAGAPCCPRRWRMQCPSPRCAAARG